MKKINKSKMVIAKKIILHRVMANAIIVIMKKLECLVVKVNVIFHMKEIIQFYVKVNVKKDILNHLKEFVNYVRMLMKVAINVTMKKNTQKIIKV